MTNWSIPVKASKVQAIPIKIWLELIDLVGIVLHMEPVKLRDLVAGRNTLWYGPWLCPGWVINGETAGLFNLYQLIFYLDIYFSILFSCFVMQSLKLHVLSLTKNIDDLKLQLVSYLFLRFIVFFFPLIIFALLFYADLPNHIEENYVLYSWFRIKTRRQTMFCQLMHRIINRWAILYICSFCVLSPK